MQMDTFFTILIIITGIICYYNSCSCDFVFDDISAIKDNKDLRPNSPMTKLFFNDFWGTPMHKEQSHKSYRPLCVLTFRMNYFLQQLDPFGYHLVNVLLHSAVCVLFFRVCQLLLQQLSSFVAAILFTVHPIHTEAVTGVVGRAEILSSIFFLQAFILYYKACRYKRSTGWKELLLSVVSISLAMLCKEQGITVAGICFVYELFLSPKPCLPHINSLIRNGFSPNCKTNHCPLMVWSNKSTKRLSVLSASIILLLLFRLHIMGSQLPVFTRFDNPASVAPTPSRQLTYNFLLSVNMGLLLFPCDLCCDWTMGTIPLVESFTDPRNINTVFVYILLAALTTTAYRTDKMKHRAVILMGLSFMVLPFIPASNLFFPVGFVVAERVLYMPSMGFCILVAYGWSTLMQKYRKLSCMLIVVLIFTYSLKTHYRNRDWRDEYSIFMAGLRVNQRNAKLFNNVGHALESQGRYEEALEYFQTAVRVQEDDVGAHINVGRTYNNLKMYQEAENAYMRAKELLPKAKPGESYQTRIAPNHLSVFLNLANLISKNTTRLEEADLLYRQAISMRSDYTQAYINRGDVLIKLNRTKEAQEVYERALLYDSNNPDIYYNLGVVFLEQGKPSQALAYLDKALEIDPDHEQALLNSAVLLQEFGRPHLRRIAHERLHKLLFKDASNERVYFNLGMLAMDEKNIGEAEQWFRKAVSLKDDFRSALFNLALLLADEQRPLEAAPFLNQLVKFHPDHIKGLILLGDIYINSIKDLDAAEQCYRRILELDPDNVQGLHNLCVVYVERGKLLEAYTCLEQAHNLSPNEEYIRKHMQIVKTRLNKMRNVAAKARTATKLPSDVFSENAIGKSENVKNQSNPTKQGSWSVGMPSNSPLKRSRSSTATSTTTIVTDVPPNSSMSKRTAARHQHTASHHKRAAPSTTTANRPVQPNILAPHLEDQHYSSRVLKTEPVLVKHVNDIDRELGSRTHTKSSSPSKWSSNRLSNGGDPHQIQSHADKNRSRMSKKAQQQYGGTARMNGAQFATDNDDGSTGA